MTCSQWACRATQIQALRGILMQTCTTMSVSTTASGSGDLSGCGRRSRVSARSASASTVSGPELKGAMSAAQHTHTRCSSSTHYQPVSISPPLTGRGPPPPHAGGSPILRLPKIPPKKRLHQSVGGSSLCDLQFSGPTSGMHSSIS